MFRIFNHKIENLSNSVNLVSIQQLYDHHENCENKKRKQFFLLIISPILKFFVRLNCVSRRSTINPYFFAIVHTQDAV